MFDFGQYRMWKKLKSWKEKKSSSAGEEVLIKSLAEFILTLYYDFFSTSLYDHSKSTINTFGGL